MPTYDFQNKKTKKTISETMPIAELEPYLSANPHLEQVFNKVTISRGGPPKPPDYFRDKLKEIKKANKHNTIDIL